MMLKKLGVVVLSVIAFSPAYSSAATIVNGGTVHFKGEVVNSACAVDAGSVEQTVELGQYPVAKLNAADKVSDAVGFNIKLADCDTSVAKTAAIAFSGVTVNDANTTVLALQNSASGSATNVGIQILDRTGTPVPLDGATASSPTTLTDGTNIIPFQARYYATGTATAGIANADATFKIQYE
ncbi:MULTISPECIES: type 1 fimbrial major subunit FimA [Klebsiella pneumoniae complex]|uniref:type 1 fimbrial major subunit FimA n=1 Tax=Klebsiella pneumoniae complex TaxID=3390273 RepID=UPI000DE6F1B2|nr:MULTISPECIES: type 1 fimbrial major subunit FimA [Klebsiella]MDE4727962.1 type 1 fimbrial major subunit FimA [Klebsiella pneumoniae]MDE4739136.1 type 1 fimbrial major subunit FimA [Klebsiella pneumoniae]MDE4776340.1 type 1 fimbrial major subunit FimA [Klebsiella pneumoniae]MDE4787219.1 type 1 fimbrial major subunit FimA [Klebsiella pneumoniae]MDE4801763.1 type 1 fimbrial major subunit FimA [Klebsiella pneumoniae]